MKAASKSTLASNQEWSAWGKIDPLHGVATLTDRSKDGANPWTDDAFYELGAGDWSFFKSKWQQYGVEPGVCVEIGCGAGRMSVHLAQYFQTLHGIDISPGMIEYASRRAPANVRFHVTSGTEIPLPNQSVDAVFSTHVLQHLSSPAAAAAYFKEMGRVLRPEGTIMLHVPIIAWPWGRMLGLHEVVHKAKVFLDAGQAHLHRSVFRLGWTRKPPMQVTWYEVNWLHQTLQKCGMCDIEVRVLLGGSKMAVQHPFIFARKEKDPTQSA